MAGLIYAYAVRIRVGLASDIAANAAVGLYHSGDDCFLSLCSADLTSISGIQHFYANGFLAENAVSNLVQRVNDVMEYGGGTDSSSTPVADKPFIKPTNGSLTQGYRAGHYAIDLANRSRPDIYAAAAGTVTKSVCSGGGSVSYSAGG